MTLREFQLFLNTTTRLLLMLCLLNACLVLVIVSQISSKNIIWRPTPRLDNYEWQCLWESGLLFTSCVFELGEEEEVSGPTNSPRGMAVASLSLHVPILVSLVEKKLVLEKMRLNHGQHGNNRKCQS